MKLKHYVIYFLLCCIGTIVYGQEIPPTTYYSVKDYFGENQNWGITQAKNQFIYIANNKGLLEFNGGQWQLYPSPNETIIRSVKAIDNTIYTGSYMEFGYWQKDSTNQLAYTSLSKNLETPLKEDEQFWNISKIDDWMLFQSLQRIYIYSISKQNFNIIDINEDIKKMFTIANRVYFQSNKGTIYTILNGKATVLASNNNLASTTIINMFKRDDKSLLLLTENDGFYILNDNTLSKWNASPKLLENINIYSALQLANGDFAIGTISKGIAVLGSNGSVTFTINQDNGLGNNTVLSLFEDHTNNLWLGLDNGINCINLNSPYRIYNDAKGNLGSVYTAITHNNILYLGTNQGLFYKAEGGSKKFQFIPNTKGQVWSLKVIDGTLFCAHNLGTFTISETTATLIPKTYGTWDVKPIPNRQDLILQGTYSGLSVLKKQGNTWQVAHTIDGFDNSSRFFEYISPQHLLVNHEYKGIYKLKLNSDYTTVNAVEKNTISKGLHSSLLRYNNNIYYGYKDGIFKYNETTNQFKKDSILSQSFSANQYSSGKLVATQASNLLWSFSEANINYFTPAALSTSPQLQTINLSANLRETITGYESVLELSPNRFLVGATNGYITIDISKFSNTPKAISINTIINSDDKDNSKLIQDTSDNTFSPNENTFMFKYNIPDYDTYAENQYQYKLSTVQEEWTPWTNAATISFQYLPFGDYTFTVRGRTGNTLTANQASYNFTIERPWYISTLMLLVYALGVILFSIFMHKVYTTYYRRKNQALKTEQQRELKVKALENQKALVEVKNENLQLDVENKNRELAISTMSLIKKNEFLSDIKKELSLIPEQPKTVKSVIKLINKNLNNTDDWKFFEQAFNNADKDFLKKIKQKHANLTPNDLRLCAYLRLNLSSKEIAPLLNISPRSVEVKRYRLRKKMNLEHDTNLTDYILEL